MAALAGVQRRYCPHYIASLSLSPLAANLGPLAALLAANINLSVSLLLLPSCLPLSFVLADRKVNTPI